MRDPVEAILERENLQEIRDAIDTKGVDNVELLCYVCLIGLRIILDRAIAELDDVERK